VNHAPLRTPFVPGLLLLLLLLALFSAPVGAQGFDKFELWQGETKLRGANIWLRVVVPELDGDEFLGNGHVGPPYTQEDFDRLATLGANWVNVSGPGLYTMTPPYRLDEKVQAEWDRLLALIAKADLFAVISLRTGPGRSDFTFYRDGAGNWFDRKLLIETVWTEQAAQDAWVAMWRHTAERYRKHAVVVGYDLMTEPNAPGALLEIWEPNEFMAQHAGTLYDWNRLYPRISRAVREVDPDTPILIGAMGWSAVAWLPSLEPTGDSRTVYVVHQYEPQDSYTHQGPDGRHRYPGRFDADHDGEPEPVDRAWLNRLLNPVDQFEKLHGVPVAVNEFGVQRWVPGGAVFLKDLMALFEQRGMNHALWMFSPSWPPARNNDEFDLLHGPDANHHAEVESNALVQAIREGWRHNRIRPSTVGK